MNPFEHWRVEHIDLDLDRTFYADRLLAALVFIEAEADDTEPRILAADGRAGLRRLQAELEGLQLLYETRPHLERHACFAGDVTEALVRTAETAAREQWTDLHRAGLFDAADECVVALEPEADPHGYGWACGDTPLARRLQALQNEPDA